MYCGRVFFRYQGGPEERVITAIYAQPLANHVDNVCFLIQQFRNEFLDPRTKEQLALAAQAHDQGKKHKLRLTYIPERQAINYGFSGHRFHVLGQDPYVDALIRAHHEYSVERINQERVHHLFTAWQRKRFPDDLYLLCIADNLEAELAVKTLEPDKTERPRAFIDFVSIAQDGYFNIIPWPFKVAAFELPLQYLVLPLKPAWQKPLTAKNGPQIANEIYRALQSAAPDQPFYQCPIRLQESTT